MKGDPREIIDLHAHRERLWGKDYANNCDRKSRRNASKPRTGRFGKLLWLSTSNGKKAQGTLKKA